MKASFIESEEANESIGKLTATRIPYQMALMVCAARYGW